VTRIGVIHQRDCGEPRGRIHAKALVRSIALDPARAYADLACTWARESSRSAAMRSSRRTIRSASMCPVPVARGRAGDVKTVAALRSDRQGRRRSLSGGACAGSEFWLTPGSSASSMPTSPAPGQAARFPRWLSRKAVGGRGAALSGSLVPSGAGWAV
jgi:hypothetical protein